MTLNFGPAMDRGHLEGLAGLDPPGRAVFAVACAKRLRPRPAQYPGERGSWWAANKLLQTAGHALEENVQLPLGALDQFQERVRRVSPVSRPGWERETVHASNFIDALAAADQARRQPDNVVPATECAQLAMATVRAFVEAEERTSDSEVGNVHLLEDAEIKRQRQDISDLLTPASGRTRFLVMLRASEDSHVFLPERSHKSFGESDGKRLYHVFNDYGMGAVGGLVWANCADDIVRGFPELGIIDEPPTPGPYGMVDAIDLATQWHRGILWGLREQRISTG